MSEAKETVASSEEKKLTKEQKYHVLCKQLRSHMKQVESRGGIERVVNAVAEFPLENNKPRLLNQHEWLLFGLFLELLDNKIEIMTELTQEILKKQETLTTSQKEENNGDTNHKDGEENSNFTQGLAPDRDASQG